MDTRNQKKGELTQGSICTLFSCLVAGEFAWSKAWNFSCGWEVGQKVYTHNVVFDFSYDQEGWSSSHVDAILPAFSAFAIGRAWGVELKPPQSGGRTRLATAHLPVHCGFNGRRWRELRCLVNEKSTMRCFYSSGLVSKIHQPPER